MARIAMMMLFGAGGRYLALIFGLSFAVLLITQQVAIFLGVLERGTGPLQNIGTADIWVASESTQYVDLNRGMSQRDLWRVRSLEGVAWVKPMLSYPAIAEREDGHFYVVQVMGLDHATLVGRPPEILEGNLEDLRLPDTIMVEVSGLKHLPVQINEMVRIHDRTVRVVGFCRARSGLLSKPQVFATNENVARMLPLSRRQITFALLRVKPDADPVAVRDAIRAIPNLTAFTADQLRWESWKFVMFQTGIGINFAVTVGLGLIVGLVVSTAAFNQFTSDHLPHFALLKAVGTRPRQLVGMILLQALVAGTISYGIGIGLAGLMTIPGLAPDAELSSLFPWQLMVAGVLPMLLCISVASTISLLRVIRVDPVTLFQ